MTLPLIDHLALRVRDVGAAASSTSGRSSRWSGGSGELAGPGFAIEGGGDFWIGEGDPPAAPIHVAFAAADRATVDKFHRAAVEAGGRDNGAPGLRRSTTPGITRRSSLTRTDNVEAVFHGDSELPAA